MIPGKGPRPRWNALGWGTHEERGHTSFVGHTAGTAGTHTHTAGTHDSLVCSYRVRRTKCHGDTSVLALFSVPGRRLSLSMRSSDRRLWSSAVSPPSPSIAQVPSLKWFAPAGRLAGDASNGDTPVLMLFAHFGCSVPPSCSPSCSQIRLRETSATFRGDTECWCPRDFYRRRRFVWAQALTPMSRESRTLVRGSTDSHVTV